MKKQDVNNLKKDIQTIKDGLKILHSVQPGLLLCSISMAVTDAIFPFINIFMSAKIVNEILGNKNIKTLAIYAIITVILNLIVGILSHALNRARELKNSSFYFKSCLMFSYINHKVDYEMLEKSESREDFQKVYDNLINGGLSALHIYSYELMKNIVSVVIAAFMSYGLFNTYSKLPFEGMLGFVNSHLAIVILIMMIFAAAIVTTKLNLDYNKQLFCINQKRANYNKYWQYYEREYLENIKTGKDIRMYNQKKLILSEIKNALNNMLHVDNKKSQMDIKCNVGMTIMTDFINIMVYILVALKAVIGVVGAGSIIQYTGAVNKFINGFSGIAMALVGLKENNKYVYALNEYIENFSKPTSEELTITDVITNDIEIEFHNVSFKYPNSNKYALKNFSALIRHGEKIAVVGMNGSGKTTMVKLLCRLYEPQHGFISINGIDIRKFNRDEYMKLLAVVFQDFKLLGFSILQNIAASALADKDKVINVVNEVGLGETINNFNEGIDTNIYKDFYDNGVEISGGEAQRIAIARALYKNSPIIVLDEPTAALDPVVEADIYVKLNTLVGNNTAIYISHRLSSCKFCDRILVFNDGEIIQEGRHDDLIKVKGKYQELWNSQAQYYN